MICKEKIARVAEFTEEGEMRIWLPRGGAAACSPTWRQWELVGGSDACTLKRWLQWTQKVVLSLVDRFLKEGVPTGVAQLIRLQGPEVQPLREENRAMLQIQFVQSVHQTLWPLGSTKDILINFQGSFSRGIKIWGGTGLWGNRRLIQQKAPKAHAEAKHCCPSERSSSDIGGQNEAEHHSEKTMHGAQSR